MRHRSSSLRSGLPSDLAKGICAVGTLGATVLCGGRLRAHGIHCKQRARMSAQVRGIMANTTRRNLVKMAGALDVVW